MSTLKHNEIDQPKGELVALRDLFEYNTFVRKKYLSFISRLPKKSLMKDRGASYPSILDIFAHVLDVYQSWIHLYETGRENPGEISGLSLNEVRKLELEADRQIDNFMRKLRPHDLNRVFRIPPEEKRGRPMTWNLKSMLWHLAEEELQHRGELNALLWQDNIDPPVTSWYRWEKALEKKRKVFLLNNVRK